MNSDLMATVLTGVGVLVGVWRMVEAVRRDLSGQISAVNMRIDDVRRDLSAINVRIDNILLVDRKPSS